MKKIGRNDLIIAGILLLFGIIGLVAVEGYKTHTTKNAVAVVYVDGVEYGRYPLGQDTQVLIESADGYNNLVIRDGYARVEEASCPDKLCMNHGKINKNGETLVCLPNKVVIEIENGEDGQVDGSTH